MGSRVWVLAFMGLVLAVVRPSVGATAVVATPDAINLCGAAPCRGL